MPKQAAYRLQQTSSGYAVFRADGTYAEFLDSEDAEKAKNLLTTGRKSENSYYWTEKDLT